MTSSVSSRVHRVIVDAIGPHASLREASKAGIYVVPARDEAVRLCLPLVDRTVNALLKRMPDWSRIERDDLFQAASLGMFEGVDRFEPARGVQVQTVIWNWMRMRMNRERDLHHWTIMKPPHKEIVLFMSGGMDQQQQDHYMNKYILPNSDDIDG